MSYTPIYTRRNYVNNKAPSINAENLNAIEDAIINLEGNAQRYSSKVDEMQNTLATKVELNEVANNLEAEIGAREASEAEMRNEIAKVANSNLQTSSDVLDFAMDGNIQSARFEGYARKSKNLLKNLISGSYANVSYALQSDGSVIANGTPNNMSGWKACEITLNAGKYTFSLTTNVPFDIEFNVVSGSNILGKMKKNTSVTITLASTTQIVVWNDYLSSYASKTFSNNRIAIQVEEGSTATSFEPYGIIKPSGVVESRTENLFGNNFTVGNWFNVDGSPVLNSSREADLNYYKVKSGSEISVQCFYNGVPSNAPYGAMVIEYDSDKNYIKGNNRANASTITLNAGTKYIRVSTLMFDVVIASGDKHITEFVQHKASEITLPYTPLGVGDIHDELIVNADGSGKFVKRIGKATVNDFGIQGWNTTRLLLYNNANADLTKELMCEKYSFVSWSSYESFDNVIATNGTYVAIRDTSFTSREDAVSKVGNMDIYFVLQTPTETALTASQVAQILALKTFADNTYIDADGMHYEIGYAQNSAKAIKELQNIIKNLLNPQTESQLEEVGQISALLIEEGEEANV